MFAKYVVSLLVFLSIMQAVFVFSGIENKDSSLTSSIESARIDLTGLWKGKWTGSVFSGDVSLSINQSSTNVSGILKLGLDCFPSGSVSGTVKGTSFQMEVKSSDDSVLIYSGTLQSEDAASGSWHQQSGKCPLSNGQWELSRNL